MGRGQDLRQALASSGARPLTTVPLRLCELGVARLRVQAVGVALIADAQPRSLLSASGELAGTVEELQFSLGEGPCLEAFRQGSPSLEADLTVGGRLRWPAFAEAATAAGARAVFAFPLQVGAARFGVLDVVRTSPGALGDEELADALVLADIATEAVLLLQAGAGPDGLADAFGVMGSHRLVVHQATGMVCAQLEVSVADALASLRARSYAEGRSLHEVARDVVTRVLVFTP